MQNRNEMILWNIYLEMSPKKNRRSEETISREMLFYQNSITNIRDGYADMNISPEDLLVKTNGFFEAEKECMTASMTIKADALKDCYSGKNQWLFHQP